MIRNANKAKEGRRRRMGRGEAHCSTKYIMGFIMKFIMNFINVVLFPSTTALIVLTHQMSHCAQ